MITYLSLSLLTTIVTILASKWLLMKLFMGEDADLLLDGLRDHKPWDRSWSLASSYWFWGSCPQALHWPVWRTTDREGPSPWSSLGLRSGGSGLGSTGWPSLGPPRLVISTTSQEGSRGLMMELSGVLPNLHEH
ncbi:hypothetical protein MTR67_048125 [Solanum verrucosum]|uniref:Uncharacterized protein n=1 Tax=Solanum verrucosum TaxID=315347 RepID=A0AAF0ZZ97_SOLVR|nr:hypothetical protein MTR67_048125 [Solanum verrucosum]